MTFKKLLVSAMIASAVAPAYAQQEEFVVEDIEVKGLQRVALGAALTYIPVRVGDEVSELQIRSAIRSLYSSTHFDYIDARRDDNTLIFNVSERPTISDITFDGNSDIKDEQLQESLTDNNIVVGEPLDRTTIAGIEKGLEDFYHSVGKYNASVEVQVVDLPRNRVELRMTFEEGDAAEIAQINIVGNKAFSDAQLLDTFELKDDLPWWNVIGEKRYQKQQLSGDLETLESFYRDRGYLRFRVESVQVSMTPNREGVYITLNVNEGDKYNVSETDVIGDLKGHEEMITRIAQIEEGTLYNAAQITYIEDMISRFYGRYGYAYPEVRAIPEHNEEDKTVKITFSINPGKRVYVRRIKFEGNSATQDRVLRREMRQLEGAWLSDSNVEQGKVRLERLGFFETVETSTERVEGSEDEVDITYKVKEQPSGSFNAGIGYGDYSGLQLNAGIQQNNFLGTGNRVGFNISTSRFNKNANISYTDPYFTINGVSLSGQVYMSEFDAGRAENLVQYNQKTYGVSTGLSFPVDEINRLNFGVGYKNQEVAAANTDSYEQISNFFQPFLNPEAPDEAVGFDIYELNAGWSRVTLNRGTFPTSGSSQRLGVEVATPLSDVQYFRFNYEYNHYFPITRDQQWTFLTRLNLGYGNGYGESDGGNEFLLPFWENFRVAGQGDLRGFESNTVGPRAVRLDGSMTSPPGVDGSPDGIPSTNQSVFVSRYAVGGNAKVVGGLELIVPTPFIDEGMRNSVRTSVFVDFGMVWDTEFNYDTYKDLPMSPNSRYELSDYSSPGDFRASAGVSVQWISPMGPLTFSLGRALKEVEGDETQVFSFNIGTTF